MTAAVGSTLTRCVIAPSGEVWVRAARVARSEAAAAGAPGRMAAASAAVVASVRDPGGAERRVAGLRDGALAAPGRADDPMDPPARRPPGREFAGAPGREFAGAPDPPPGAPEAGAGADTGVREFGDGELKPPCDGEPEPVPPPTPPGGGPLTGGIGTDSVLRDAVVTLGVLSCGVATGPTVTDGTVTDGTVADGTVTDGTVPAGTVAEGTLTVGTVTVGTDTEGIAATAGRGDDRASTVEHAATAADRPQPIAPRLSNAPSYTIENPQSGVYTRGAAAERCVGR